jgi:GH24 family phage-related lysozyme (muramidase)
VENRFVEMDREFRGISARSDRGKGTRAFATSYATGRSFDWARPQSAAQRVLVILIENGGIDLGIPDLVDKILSVLPGSSVLPDDLKQKLVAFLRQQIKIITDNLLESAELAANRYTAAKPDPYSDVVVLRDGTASYSDLKSQLISLSQAGKIIDLFILTHGSDKYISVAGGVDDDKIRRMKSESGKPLAIRSVYMMNCVGSSLNDAWLKAGAKVSSGSRGNNYLPEPTMFFFWQNWKAGQNFESAATGAYKATVKLMNDAVRSFLTTLPVPGSGLLADAIDFNDLDFVKSSAPVISGRGELTISSDDLSFTESISAGMAITVVPVRSLSDGDADAGGAMTISDAGFEFVKGWEGFVPKLYNDPVGHCTVGYGTLVHKGNCDGRDSERPYLSGVTKEEATRLLTSELAEKQAAVRGAIKVPLNQNQYDALVSFAYNVGASALQKSTLLKLLNQGKYDAVPGELKKWTKARKNGQLIDLPGLVERRAGEAALFQKPTAAASQSLPGRGWGSFGRALSQHGVVVPVRHSYRYCNPSTVVTTQSNFSAQQNPAVAVIAGIEIGDAIQIGLAGVSIIQAQVSASQGSFYLSYDKAARLLTAEARAAMPGSQATKTSYSKKLFWIGELKEGFADATILIEWEGNPYGEISTPVIRRDLEHSTEWTKSSNNLTITKLDRIPLPKTDPRAWPIVYSYEGTFDPVGNGYYEYSGEFEINAFGGLKFTRHDLKSRSLIDWTKMGKPEDYVRWYSYPDPSVPEIPKEQLDYLRAHLP